MVDYTLRKEVKRLARAQKRKVEMLVQAFESVLPTVAIASEKKLMDTHKTILYWDLISLAWCLEKIMQMVKRQRHQLMVREI